MVTPVHCFVIAEAGVNHNGSAELALRLVDAAADAGADAVKFQSFSARRLVAPGTDTAEYQRGHTGQTDQYAMLEALELPVALLARLKEHADERGIEFMSTPFDEDCARELVALGMRRIKVSSGDLNNLPLLEALTAYDLPMIVSTGMADLAEVFEAARAIASARARHGFLAPLAQRLTLLQCTSSYPAPAEDANLRAMLTLAANTGLPTGYSDHTEGIAVALAATALGACVLEKHFTLDRDLPGPDHKASLIPSELRHMIKNIRTVEQAMGDGVKAPRPVELQVRALVRRSVTLVRPIPAGQTLHAHDLDLLRPGTGIAPAQFAAVLGRVAARDLPAGTTLQWSDLA